MDSWMPWTIMRNFVRAFFPTLSLLIARDLWRNLGHASAMQRQILLIDAIALCAILAIRLQPPLTPVWEQLKYLFQWSWIGILSLVTLLSALLHPRESSSLGDGLLAVMGYVFYCDLSRTCKISREDAESHVYWIYAVVGGSGWIVWSIVSSFREMGRFPWQDVLGMAVVLLLWSAITALRLRRHRRSPAPMVQELGLNR